MRHRGRNRECSKRKCSYTTMFQLVVGWFSSIKRRWRKEENHEINAIAFIFCWFKSTGEYSSPLCDPVFPLINLQNYATMSNRIFHFSLAFYVNT